MNYTDGKRFWFKIKNSNIALVFVNTVRYNVLTSTLRNVICKHLTKSKVRVCFEYKVGFTSWIKNSWYWSIYENQLRVGSMLIG